MNYEEQPEPLELEVVGNTLTIIDTNTDLNRMSITLDTNALSNQRTLQPNTIGDLSELHISLLPKSITPKIWSEIQQVTEVFVVKQKLEGDIIIEFPIPEIPEGFTIRDVDLYSFSSADDVEGEFWSPVFVAINYAGTAEAPIVIISLEWLQGIYFFGFRDNM